MEFQAPKPQIFKTKWMLTKGSQRFYLPYWCMAISGTAALQHSLLAFDTWLSCQPDGIRNEFVNLGLEVVEVTELDPSEGEEE